MHRVTLTNDETLYREGEATENAFLILAGEVSMRRNEQDLRTGKGAVIGLYALIGRPYASTARAVGRCDLLAFTRRELRGMIRSDPDRAMQIIDAIIDLVGKVHEVSESNAC
jgi:CRP-like cAMP-binding protein